MSFTGAKCTDQHVSIFFGCIITVYIQGKAKFNVLQTTATVNN